VVRVLPLLVHVIFIIYYRFRVEEGVVKVLGIACIDGSMGGIYGAVKEIRNQDMTSKVRQSMYITLIIHMGPVSKHECRVVQ